MGVNVLEDEGPTKPFSPFVDADPTLSTVSVFRDVLEGRVGGGGGQGGPGGGGGGIEDCDAIVLKLRLPLPGIGGGIGGGGGGID